MIPIAFYKNRPYLDNEYSDAHFDPASGLEPEVLAAGLKKIFLEKFDTNPAPTVRAEMFAFLYDNVQIEINAKNLFAAKINHKRKLLQYTFDAKKHVLENYDPDTLALQNLAVEWGCVPLIDYHHTLPDWNEIMRLGFPGLLNRAVMRKAELELDASATEEQKIFTDSVITSYEAILRLLRRIRDMALKDPEAKLFCDCVSELLEHEPRTLYEAMMMTDLFMMVYEVGMENARSFGLIDHLYAPYYRADLAAGRCTEEEARELMRYLFNKYSAANRNAGQPFGIGRSDADGNYLTTELTQIILEVYDELKIVNPKIHVRYHPNMPESLLRQILEMIRHGVSSINLISDEAVYRGYEKIGIDRSIAQHYVPQGCYEPTLMGLEEPLICCSWISIPKAIEFALNNGQDMLTGKMSGTEFACDPESYEEFYRRFLIELDTIVTNVIRAIDGESLLQHLINPSPVYSGTMASCMERAKDIFNGGMQYSNTSVKACGVGTAVDSLMIIKKYVYEEKRITLSALRDLMRANWQGGESLRLDILKETNRYGNGFAEPDNTARDIYDHIASLVVGRKNKLGGVYRLGADSVMHCVDHAVHVAATPDGRYAAAPFSKNLCSVAGMEREGVTANILSVTNLDTSNLVNAAVCDFIIHPSAIEGERGMEAFLAMTKVYFARGGMTLQGNVFSIEDLHAAKKEPEKYASLQVRICGWNEYFVRMSEVRQNDFIARCQTLR